METYKKAKDYFEMVDYLADKKRVVYNTVSKIEAMRILEEYNYINVITPFKHHFAKKNSTDEVIKDKDNNHIYERDVDFGEYYSCYIEERKTYPTIIANILDFEAHFKSAITHAIMVEREAKICSIDDFNLLMNELQERVIDSTGIKDTRKPHILNRLLKIKDQINDYHDIYCYFDRLSLGNLLALYDALDRKAQNSIYHTMIKYDWGLCAEQQPDFSDKVFTLVDIRNCVMHNNSIEILKRFYNAKDKTLRFGRNKRKYLSLIELLEKEK